jgi:hypothetical protein
VTTEASPQADEPTSEPHSRPNGKAVAIDQAAYRPYALLLAFLQKAEVDAIFAQAPVRLRDESTIADVMKRATDLRRALGPYRAGQSEPISANLQALVSEVRGRTAFKRHYEAKADFEFVRIPIASLLTPQWMADVGYVSELANRLPDKEDSEVDFAFCFPEGDLDEPIINGNTVVFSSHAPNVAIAPVPVVRPVGEAFELVLRAEPRPNFVMVAELNGRLILENGVHKALALLTKGRTHLSAVLKHVGRPEELAIQQQSTLFAPQTYFSAARPPLVTDFLRPVAVPALWRATTNIWRVVVQVEQIPAPALRRG